MKNFWWLLGMAFVDLAVAGSMAGRGERGLALLFMVLAVLTAGFALFSKPALRRDPRGRLQEVDPPFARVLGVAGALAILIAAGYVAVHKSQPEPMQAVLASRPSPVAAPAPVAAPRRSERQPTEGNWLHKCVDAAGLASFQSAPCPPGSQQEWRRVVTPESEPARPRDRPASTPQVYYQQPMQGGSGRRVAKKNSAACQAAREADRRYRQQPLSLVKHDGLRRHGDAIRQACG